VSKKELNFDNAFSDLENLSEEEKKKRIEENNIKKKNQKKESPEVEKNIEEKNENQDKKENKKKNENEDPWNKTKKDYYRTTITIDSETEENYLTCKRKFRKELKTRLTKQDAVELGMILLRNLDSEIIEKIRSNFSPDDDIIKKIKELINNT